MTSIDPPSLIRQVGFRHFRKSQRVKGINAKSSRNVSAMCKLVNLSNLMKKKNFKKIQNYFKKVEFCPDLLKVIIYCISVKRDGDTIAISKFPQRKNK